MARQGCRGNPLSLDNIHSTLVKVQDEERILCGSEKSLFVQSGNLIAKTDGPISTHRT